MAGEFKQFPKGEVIVERKGVRYNVHFVRYENETTGVIYVGCPPGYYDEAYLMKVMKECGVRFDRDGKQLNATEELAQKVRANLNKYC